MRIDRKPDNKEFTSVIYLINVHKALREINGGDRYDQYRDEWNRASVFNYVPPYPLQLDFELNYSCNFSCKMCTWSAESSMKKGGKTWFSFDIFKEIIDEGVKKGLKAIRFNYINEPLIRKDIVKFISYAKEAGVLDTYFSTNGSLLSEEMASSLIDSGLDRIQVSIDAYTQQTFDRIRVGGNLQKIINNVNKIIEIRKKKNRTTPILRVNFVKTKDNIHELNNFIEYWRLIADGIGVQNFINIIDKEKITSQNNVLKVDFRCPQPFYHMTVRYNGNILPCCSFFGAETPVARVKTTKANKLSKVENLAFDNHKQTKLLIQNIEDAWNGETMNFFRRIHKSGEYWRHPACYKCVLKSSHADETFEL